ncbi:MAG: DNA translocase FtsK [Clostridiaceae bacterium]|nr:DNA translocase FtsK [Clostridiaceae bacterium]
MAESSTNNNSTTGDSRKKVNKVYEIISVFILAAAILLGFMFWAPEKMTGILGKIFKQIGYGFFGTFAVIFPVVLLLIGLDRMLSKTKQVSRTRKNCTVLLFLCSVILISAITLDSAKVLRSTFVGNKSSVLKSIPLFWKSGLKPSLVSQSTTWGGGLVGGICGFALSVVAGKIGSIIILIAMILALIVVVFNVSYTHYVQKSANAFQATRQKLEEKRRLRAESMAWENEQTDFYDNEESNLYSYEIGKTDYAQMKHDYSATDGDDLDTDLDNEPEFGFDLAKATAGHDKREVSAEWIKRELAEGRGEIYEEPPRISFDLPEGSWSIDPADQKLTSEEPNLDYNLASYNYSGKNQVESDTKDAGQSNTGQGKFSSSGNLSYKEKSTIISEEGFESTQSSQITTDITETELDHIEEQGRAHWEDRSENSTDVKIPPTIIKKQKQIALTDKYIPPPIELLNEDPKNGQDPTSVKEIQSLGARLEQTLTDFGVDAKVVNYTTGPTITRFELAPGPGVKVSRITNLADDIALSLAAIGVRIEAPIPGKSVIGIEIPNKETHPVLLRGIIESAAFKKAESKLTAGIGRDIQGNEILCDLQKMPHLLIAGATGSGKSVCLNAIIISLIYRSGPADLKMIMIDPKVVELNIYNGIPHLLQPVVTDPKKAYGALNWAVMEMEDRYEKFAENSVRDFTAYNTLIESGQIEGEKLAYILIIIDELSDLMATTPTEVEDAIARLTAMARAAGIHLIIATQRPSVDVITGVIKANIPSRIAFTVASQVDSRTILDMGGAEKLLGKGDLLYYPQSASKPQRGQGGFVTDAEVERVTRYLKGIYETDYDESVAEAIEQVGSGGAGPKAALNQDSEEDELLEDAIKLVIEAEYASISLLQRRLSIGYPRAARLVDRLYELNIIGPFEGSKPRKVLVTPQEYFAAKSEDDANQARE